MERRSMAVKTVYAAAIDDSDQLRDIVGENAKASQATVRGSMTRNVSHT